MKDKELVSEFNLRDKFNWDMKMINKEALVAAKRRGEFEGYIVDDVEVGTPVQDGEYICYPVKVYGRNLEQS